MSRLALAASVVLLCLPLAGTAAIAQRPGLWTVTVQLSQALPEIDPRMLEQMEMMGLEIPKQVIRPTSYEVCLTAEQVAKDRLPDIHDAGSGCTARNLVRVGDRATGDLQCDGRLRGGGKAQVTLTGPQNFVGNASFEGTSQEGFPLFVNGALNGQWRSDNCGNVKPYES